MDLPNRWICIDVLATQLHGEIIVHSVDTERVARPLRRIARKSWCRFDFRGENLFTEVATDVLRRAEHVDHVATEGGFECRTHWIVAPDSTAVGLLIWLAPAPVTAMPVFNAWVLDLETITTRSNGDGLDLIGDGRRAGEERPLRDLLTGINPDDTAGFLSLSYDALTAQTGTLAESVWSIKPHREWVHFWSAARVGVIDTSRRTVHGLTLRLPHRELDLNLGRLVDIAQGTVLIVDVDRRAPLATGGMLAPLSTAQIDTILDQIDFAPVVAAPMDTAVTQITFAGSTFRASSFALPTVQNRPVHPAAVVLTASR
ncbi:hypothetical protein [Nocardia callitridis]